MTDFFVSDTHFGHERIIPLANRPFASVDEMDAFMIERWNEKVQPGDTVYHLGDFAFSKDPEKYFEQLNGNKILIRGNHDHSNTRAMRWGAQFDQFMYKRGLTQIHLCHYPLFDWNCRYHGSLHFYGHIHNSIENVNPRKNSFNLSAEVMGYEPKTLEEILSSVSPVVGTETAA